MRPPTHAQDSPVRIHPSPVVAAFHAWIEDCTRSVTSAVKRKGEVPSLDPAGMEKEGRGTHLTKLERRSKMRGRMGATGV